MAIGLSSAEAAPTHAFPAVRRSPGPRAWHEGAPAAPLPVESATPARLSLGWDPDSLYVHVANAPSSARLVLDFPGIDAAVESGGEGVKTSVAATGAVLEGAEVSAFDNAWDVRIPWKSLGHGAVTPGQAFPCNVRWRVGTGRNVEIPGGSLAFNPLTWGIFFLSDGVPFDRCAPTLTRPFLYRFDQGADTGRPGLRIDPEPVAGLCLPADVRFLATNRGEDRVLRNVRTAGGPARFDLPSGNGSHAVGASIRPLAVTTSDPSTYFALPTGRRLREFTGAEDWPVPADWGDYWARAKADLAKVPINPRLTEIKDRETATGRLYRVALDSVGDVTIVCWYYVPKAVDVMGDRTSRRYPAVQIMPGYGAEEPPLDRTASGYITLSVNPRGHGPSGQFWPFPPGGHLTWNITDPESYYYRAGYLDCVRAIDFLMSRPEVDPKRVGVEGSSQGGAFALATASLDHRVAACTANIPFLSDFPTSVFFGARGGLSGLARYFQGDTEENRAARRSLSLVDTRHMAASIACPTLVSVGEMDRTCPPVGGVSAYHALPVGIPKKLLIMPGRDHEAPPEYRKAADEWFARWLGDAK